MSIDMPAIMIRCHRVPGLPESGVWQLAPVWNEPALESLPSLDVPWESVEADTLLLPYLILLSQFADLRPLQTTAGMPSRALIRSEERLHADHFPVILTCPLHCDEEQDAIASLRQWGQQGVIFTGAVCSRYAIEQLGPEAQEFGKQMRMALEEIISTAPSSSWYEASWKQAQRLAHCLAERYWQLHQEMKGVITARVPSDEAQEARPEPISLSVRRMRKREAKSVVPALVARDPVAIPVCGDLIAQELMHALLSEKGFSRFEKYAVAERHITFPNRSGDLLLSLHPLRGETWKDIEAILATLGDELVDTFCAVMALAIDIHGSEHMTDTVFFNVEDILQICQREKSNRAYLPEQKARIIEHLCVLSRISLLVRQPNHLQAIEDRVKSPILHLLSSTAGRYRQDTHEVIWERQAIKLGEWAALTAPMNPQVVLLMRIILKYHPQRERYPKRLGRWLLLQFFRNAGQASSAESKAFATVCNREDWLTYSIGELLELSGITPDKRHPDTTRGRIENGLERLIADEVLGSYSQVVESVPVSPSQPARIRERARGWWPSYAAQNWQFAPSERVRKMFQQFLLLERHS